MSSFTDESLDFVFVFFIISCFRFLLIVILRIRVCSSLLVTEILVIMNSLFLQVHSFVSIGYRNKTACTRYTVRVIFVCSVRFFELFRHPIFLLEV